MRKRNSFEKLKWKIGHGLWRKYSSSFDRLNRSPLFVEFLNQHLHVPHLPNRESLYRYINEELLKGEPIDFLEFGVHKGESLKAWMAANLSQKSRFFGFDSFKGLPEDWSDIYVKGTFDLGGEIPAFDDPRVQILPGLFQNSLPPFIERFRPQNRIVLHNDADLFSSTLFVLSKLDSYLVPGTLILFDEFCDPMHEFRAFEFYKQAFQRELRLVAMTQGLAQAAFEVGSIDFQA